MKSYYIAILGIYSCVWLIPYPYNKYQHYPPKKPALHRCLKGDCKNGYGKEEILSNAGENWVGRPPYKRIYEGYFRNGIANGKGTRLSGSHIRYIYEAGKFIEKQEWGITEIGEFLDGELHGYSLYRTGRNGSHIFHQRRKGEVSTCDECDIYIQLDKGKCVPGKIRLVLRKTGEDYTGYTDCRTGFCIEGNCTDGVGKKLTWDENDILEGQFKEGYLHGKGRERYKGHSSDDYEGDFIDGVREGWGKIIYKSKTKNEEKFKNDWDEEVVITKVYEGPVKKGNEAGRGKMCYFPRWRVTEDEFYDENKRKKLQYEKIVEAEFNGMDIKPENIRVTDYKSGLIMEGDKWSDKTVFGYLTGKVTVRSLEGQFIKECTIKQYKQLCDD